MWNKKRLNRNKNKKQSEDRDHKIVGKLYYHPLSVISLVIFIGAPTKSIGWLSGPLSGWFDLLPEQFILIIGSPVQSIDSPAFCLIIETFQGFWNHIQFPIECFIIHEVCQEFIHYSPHLNLASEILICHSSSTILFNDSKIKYNQSWGYLSSTSAKSKCRIHIPQVILHT